jgi:ABC-type transporter Mla maintaining outer membrane lipid asymmetry ATPase subunit MlaF
MHKTSVVVTHDTHLGKKIADQLVFLKEGKVAFFGPWSEFERSDDPVLRNFRLQDELIPELDATA